MNYEITIFGSGISAKIISNLLARNGFKVCLISDKYNKKDSPDTNLVTFLSSGSLNYLSSMIPITQLTHEYPEILKIKCNLNSISKKKPQPIEFKSEAKEFLGKIIQNSILENFLDKEINKSKNIKIINTNWPISANNTSTGVKLKMHNGDEIDSDLFILSSSKTNIVEQMKFNFIKKDLEQVALSISVKGKIKDKNCAFQKFTSDGPIALLPYSNTQASVVWSLKNDSKILMKDKKELTQIIFKYLGEYMDLEKIENIDKHKLQFVYAKNLLYKNTVLIGNSAHNIHPIAGQGLNLTIKDIALFVKQAIKCKSLGCRLNDQIALETFDMDRKIDNAAYAFGTFSLDSILSSNNRFLNNTIRMGLGFIEKRKYLKRLIIKSATGSDFFESF